MKKILFLILFANWSHIQCQELLPVLVEGKWGYIDTAGSIIIKPKYNYASFFNLDRFAIVKENNKFGIIDTLNQPYCKFEFDTIFHLFNGIFATQIGHKWSISDIFGLQIIKQEFDSIRSFDIFHKLYIGSKCGLYRMGGIYIPPDFDDISPVSPQRYLVANNNKLGVIDLQSHYIIEPRYDNISTINDSLTRIGSKNKWGLINSNRSCIIEPRWNHFQFFEKGYIKGYLDTLMQLVEYPSSRIISEAYNDYQEGNKDYIIVKNKSKSGIIDRAGVEVVKPLYDEITYLFDNYFLVENKTKKGVINNCGDTIVSLDYTNVVRYCSDCKKQLFKVYKKNKIGLVDFNDQVIIPAKYDYVGDRDDENFLVGENQLLGLYTSKGSAIFPAKFQTIGRYDKNIILARVGNCYALANKDTILSGPINDRIIVAANVAKLYRDDTLEVINLNEDGTVLDRYPYVGLESYKIATNEILPLPTGISYSGADNEKGFVMKFSPKHSKWGVFDKYTQNFISDIKFDRVYETKKDQYVLTEIFTDTLSFSIGGINFQSNSLFGLINLATSLEVLSNDYVYIQLLAEEKPSKFKKVDYAIHRNGSWRYIEIDRIRTINYIDDAYQYGMDRFHMGGEVKVERYVEGRSMKKFKVLVDEITQQGSIWLKDTLGLQAYISQNKYVNCIAGKWSYVGDPGNNISRNAYKPSDTFYYVDPFKHKQSIVAKSETEFGIQTDQKKEIIPFKYSSIKNINFSSDTGLYVVSEVIPTYGFIDDNGKLLIDCQYSNTGKYSDGLAPVQQKGNWGFMNRSGNIVIDFVYKKADDFHNGVAMAGNEEYYGAINLKGDTILPFVYHFLQLINDTLFLFDGKNGYGIMSFRGDTIIPPTYKKPFEFNKDGLAVIHTDGGYGIINTQGQLVVKDKYSKMGSLGENNMVCVKVRKGFRLIDGKTGKKINKTVYNKMLEESSGLLVFKGEKYFGYLNSNGEIAIPESYRKAEPFINNGAIVKENKLWGVIDKNGQFIIPSKWENIIVSGDNYIVKDNKGINYLLNNSGQILFKLDGIKLLSEFSEGFAMAQTTEGKRFFINLEGNRVFDLFFEDAKSFIHGKAAVKIRGQWGLINSKGEFVLKPRYYQMDTLNDGMGRVMISPLFGTNAYQGMMQVQPQYEQLFPLSKNVYFVRKNNKIGYIRANGSYIWQLQN